jgi:PAS domain S-box-containing protein
MIWPWQFPTAPAKAQPQIDGGAAQLGLTVLLLAQPGAERDRLRQQLSAAPVRYRLAEADTTTQALGLWHTGTVGRVVLTLTWARGEGLTLLAALGKTARLRPLPVLLVIEPGQERAALAAMKLGAADYCFTEALAAEALWSSLAQVVPRPGDGGAEPALSYRELIEHSPDIVERFDLSLRHLYVGPALTQLTGIAAEAFLGKTCRELGMEKVMVNTWEAAAAAALATGENQAIEFTTPTVAGVRHFEMAIAPERNGVGDIETLLCVSRDITERVTSHRQQQQQLAAAQEVNSVFDRINDGIIAFDNDSRCVYLNSAAQRILGRTGDDLIGKYVWEEFAEAVDTPVYDAFQWAMAQQQPKFLDYYFPPLGGWFEVRLYPDRNGLTVYFTDISDRKAAATHRQQTEALRHELLLLGHILDSVLAGYWDFDFEHGLAYYSPGLRAMLGYSEAELPDHLDSWQRVIFPEDLPVALASFDHHVQSHGKVLHSTEVRYRHKNGSTVWVICAGQVIDWEPTGQPRRMVGCHVDITHLKQTEAKLKRSEAHLREAQRIGNLGSWEFDLATGAIAWSDQVYRIFGLAVGDRPASFEALQTLFHPADRDRHRRTVEAILADHQTYDEEFCIVRPDGEQRHIQVKGEALLDSTGRLTHLTGTVLDISDRKRNEAQRQQAETQLQRLSARLSLALQSAKIGTWERVLSTDEVIWDQCLIDLYGFERLGRNASYQDWRAQVYADDIALVEARHQALIERDAPYDIEFRVWRGDGSLGWIRSSALVHRDPQGRPLSIIGINYDITESKQSAASLQQLSARLVLALEAGGIGTWNWDLDGAVDWDGRMYEIYGLTPLHREARYGDWAGALHPDDRPVAEALLQQAVRGEAVFDIEFRIQRCDGEQRWIRAAATLQRSPTGEPQEMIGINYDVTEQKQAADRLQALSARLALALESGRFGSWQWDIATGTVDWDQRLTDLYGLPQSVTDYAEWRCRVHGDDIARVEAALQATLVADAPYDVDFRIYRTDGELRWIKSSALVHRDSDGQPLTIVGINYDITDRKNAEEHLLRTTAQLEASNRELEAFAYSVSHDLRAPLRAIDGFSQALVEDYGDRFDADARDYFQRIRHNVGRMGQLIDDLLRLSRVSRSAMVYGAVNLSALVEDELAQLQAAEPDRSVVATVAPDLTVSADPTLMQVAIANLVQNAWKFTGHRPQGAIEFGMLSEGDDCIFYLRDNGAGFDMAYAHKLFGVFQRLHNTDEFPGTGIGLATVQRAIHRHGGRVWAKATVDGGATFYFTLPGPGGQRQL